MKRKKWTALMIAACMAALSITGCGAKQTDQTGGEVSTGQETAEAVSTEDSKDMFNESGQLPILKEKEKKQGKEPEEKEIEEKEIKGKIREYKGVTYHDLKRRIKIFKIT